MKNFYLISFLFFFSLQNLSAQGETCQTATAVMPGLNTADGPSSGFGCHDCSPGDIGGIPAEHADWFTYTPTESGVLDISTCGMGVDTRVWVYTGSCDNLTQIAGSDDACDFAPGEPFAASIENLNVFGGTTYYIEFDDAWEGASFNWDLNFTKVTNNVFIRGFDVCFTQIPTDQLTGNGIALNFTVGKQGPVPQSGVVVKTEIFETSNPTVAVKSFNSATFDLPEMPITMSSGAIENLPVGEYFLVQTVMPTGGDENPDDNVATSRTFQVTNRTFALDDDIFVGSLGVPGPGSIRQGQHFNFENSTEIHSASFNVIGGNAGDSVWAEIYDINAQTGVPENLLATSRKVTVESGDPAWIEIPFETAFNIPSGNISHFVCLTHMATGSNINLGVSEEIFKPRTSWIGITDDPWAPLESIGTGDFEFAYAIRVNNQSISKNITFQVDMRDEMVSADGVFLNYQLDGNTQTPISMTKISDDIWEAALSASLYSNIDYRFSNGGSDFETVPANCGEMIGGEIYRHAEIRLADVSVPPVCFSRCGICPIQGCNDPAFVICDDFEQYDTGALSPQAQFWTTWDVDSGDGVVSSANPAGGTKSLLIDGALPGETQDVLLLLNDVTDGAYELKWNQFVPTGKSAFCGILHRNPTDDIAGHGIFFDSGGSGEIWLQNQTDTTAAFTFPDNQWFEVALKVYFNNDYATLSIDGNEVAFLRFSDGVNMNGNSVTLNQLAGINFFPLDATYQWYVDDVFYREISEMEDGNVCFDATDLNLLFDNPDTVLMFNHLNHTNELSDPTTGFECFLEPDGSGSSPEINRSMWFEFTGTGGAYVLSENCQLPTLDTFPVNAQFALYTGECGDLTPVACNDTDNALTFQTIEGETYYLMFDDLNSPTSGLSTHGDFCFSLTQTVNVTAHLNMSQYLNEGGTVFPDSIYLTNFSAQPLASTSLSDNGDSTYSVTLTVEANQAFEYLFGNQTGFESTDSLSNCLGTQAVRFVDVLESDIDLDLVCWGLCDDCPDKIDTPTANLFANNKIQLFPNPTDNILNLRFENISGQPADLNVFNQLGQAVFYQKLEGSLLNEKIDVSNWQSGIYIISIQNEKGAFFEKIIVE